MLTKRSWSWIRWWHLLYFSLLHDPIKLWLRQWGRCSGQSPWKYLYFHLENINAKQILYTFCGWYWEHWVQITECSKNAIFTIVAFQTWGMMKHGDKIHCFDMMLWNEQKHKQQKHILMFWFALMWTLFLFEFLIQQLTQ